LRRLFQTGSLFLLLSVASLCRAQAVPTAERSGIAQIGGGWSIASPDYGQRKPQGISIYGTYDFTRHWGIEGDVHRASLITPTDIGQDSYLIGPRYVLHHNRLHPYAKAMLGFGRFKYQYDYAPHTAYTYKIYVFGGGLDMWATKHVNLRAVDFEYQRWPGYASNGLTPLVLSFGAAYSFR
jgi:Outer membrane protein beta-barrel domain